MNGSVAEVAIEQTYFNRKRQSLRDACFFYSIGSECKMIEAKARIAGKTIEDDFATDIPAEMKDIVNKMKAKFSAQEDPFQGRMLYKISIPRIRPKSEAVIMIKYVTEAALSQENGSTHVRIPTTLIADRYAPRRFRMNAVRADYSYDSYERIPMEIEVTGLMKGKIKHLSCSSHIIDSLQENDGTITMTANLPGTDPTEIEEDFIATFDWIEAKKVEEQSTSNPLNVLQGTFRGVHHYCRKRTRFFKTIGFLGIFLESKVIFAKVVRGSYPVIHPSVVSTPKSFPKFLIGLFENTGTIAAEFT